jgi:hypothetical protein
MFNFSEEDFVPGFRMRDPKDEAPGFRMAPDASIQNLMGAWSSAYRRYSAPDSWLTPGPASNQSTNLAFRFGGGLTGAAADSTWPSASSPLPYFDPVAADDFPQRSHETPNFPPSDMRTADYCSRVIANCKDRCAGIYADKGGSLGFPWMRKCIRDCVAPSGCVY